MLSFVLLFLVAYGTTVETAHKHGSSVFDAARSDINATVISEPNDSNSPLANSPAAGDCLICQLQQNLFTSLTNALPQTHVLQFDLTRHAAAVFFFYSRPNTPGHGRAPPTFLI
jgi:hypothetical protein